MRYLGIILLFLLSQFGYSQVDFKKVDAFIELDTIQQSVSGEVSYYLDITEPVDSLVIDAQKMSFYDVRVNAQKSKFENSDTQLIVYDSFSEGSYVLTFDYHAVPTKALYFLGWNGKSNSQIWSQGQGKYTSNWFPSFDDVSEKVIFNLSIAFDSKYKVLANGTLTSQDKQKDKTIWKYQMQKPMSSYLLALVIGEFEKETTTSASGIPLEFYYKPGDKVKVEPTYRYSAELFDFFEKEIGYKYPWEVYRQVPLEDFIYAGMENTSITTFAAEYMVDDIGYNDHNYVNINAHELAHQWFGNNVTAKSGLHHWLQEGFATYYALLAEKEIFGDEYFYWTLFQYAMELQEDAQRNKSKLLDEKASSLVFYKKGAWALHTIREAEGEKAFNKAVQNYMIKNQYNTVTTQDFLNELVLVSKFDVKTFYDNWLTSETFQQDEVYGLLFKSTFIQDYVSVQRLREVPLKEKKKEFKQRLTSDDYYPIKEELIYQLKKEPFKEKKGLIKLAISQKEPKLDLVVAMTTEEIPDSFRKEFDKLLQSKSYRAREMALFKLWEQYPEYSAEYLEQMKGEVGLGDKNLELQWLYLSILTRGYDKIDLGGEVAKLVIYTGTEYDAVIREKALTFCLKLKLINYDTVRSLIQATTHHRWQFSKYAKNQLRDLLQGKSVRDAISDMKVDLNEEEIKQISKLYQELKLTTF